ncbi:hypothetical protein FEK47_03210 [Escherichia sp. E3659]|nr:hypothetical protein FEK47_03210 [Escherichia sp. E3659]
MKKTAPDGAVSGMPAIRETGPGKNLQAITVSTCFGICRLDALVRTACNSLMPFTQVLNYRR